MDVTIPDIGDAEDVEVIEICVDPGDAVATNDALIVIESDKASMEVPAPFAGTVDEILVALGDVVNAGDAILRMEEISNGEPDGMEAKATPPAEAEPVESPSADGAQRATGTERVEIRLPDVGEAENVSVIEVAVSEGQAVAVDDLLVVVESEKASMEIPSPFAGRIVEVAVGEGDDVEEASVLVVLDAERTADLPATAPESTTPPEARPAEPVPAALTTAESIETPPETLTTTKVYAGPAVRRLARELGVDLGTVNGSGARGRIVKDDVKSFVKRTLASPTVPGLAIAPMEAVDFSRFGEIEVVPLSRIRARGAVNLHRSWQHVVHVTQHDDFDVTDLEAFRASLKDEAAAKGVRLTPLPLIMKACVRALERHPQFNASLDPGVKSLIFKRYHHIGFAVDTEDGLVVPVVRDAGGKGVYELAVEIARLSEAARSKKLKPDEMQGGSFTISSLGAIGGTGFTPIVNAPEVAILGVARLDTRPVWDGAAFVPRKMLPVSLSYDHRAINGAEAGRFIVDLGKLLSDFRRLAL
ncbi:MAG: dihydrolipoyllysine-residue acetyltransferase [Gammaproteobacteria bacterium]|nr:dihydrolipoyllysine-residue acetyltransferase [Gammaproteobacteria bacterium]